jgi:O-antigen ligase
VAASAVALAFAEPRRRRMTLVAGIAVAGVAVLALAAFAPGRSLVRDAGDRLSATAIASGDGSVGQHLTLWKLGAVITVDRPWTGVGPGVFPHVALQYADERLGERDYLSLRPYWNESPHNGLLSVSTDAGLPALVAYLILVATVGTRARRAVRDGDGLAVPVLTALIGYFVASQFITPEVSSGTVFWVMLGAACGTLPSGSGSGSGSGPGAGSGIGSRSGSGPDIRSPAPTVAPRRFGLRHRA